MSQVALPPILLVNWMFHDVLTRAHVEANGMHTDVVNVVVLHEFATATITGSNLQHRVYQHHTC